MKIKDIIFGIIVSLGIEFISIFCAYNNLLPDGFYFEYPITLIALIFIYFSLKKKYNFLLGIAVGFGISFTFLILSLWGA